MLWMIIVVCGGGSLALREARCIEGTCRYYYLHCDDWYGDRYECREGKCIDKFIAPIIGPFFPPKLPERIITHID